jgi:hypothetical protein
MLKIFEKYISKLRKINVPKIREFKIIFNIYRHVHLLLNVIRTYPLGYTSNTTYSVGSWLAIRSDPGTAVDLQRRI